MALSRVEMKDHIRLAIKNNVRKNMKYIADLTKNKYTDSFFCGFKQLDQNSRAPMVWDRKTAWKAAGFEKLAESKAKAARGRRRRTTSVLCTKTGKILRNVGYLGSHMKV